MTKEEQIEHYAEQVCRGTIIDNTVDALFTAIGNEIESLDVPQDIQFELFDYLNSTFNVS